jgi:hypothetical protein
MDLLNQHATDITNVIMALQNKVSEGGVRIIMGVFECIAQLYPREFLGMFGPVVCLMLKDVFEQAQSQAQSHSSQGSPGFTSAAEMAAPDHAKSDLTISKYFHVFGRLFLQASDVIVSSMHGCPSGEGPKLLNVLIDRWLDLFDTISVPYQRKVSCMALATLLMTVDDCSYLTPARMQSLIVAYTSTLPEMGDTDGQPFVFDAGPGSEAASGTEIARKQRMCSQDPTSSVSLRQFVEEQCIAACIAKIGQENWQQLMAQIDPTVVAELPCTKKL